MTGSCSMSKSRSVMPVASTKSPIALASGAAERRFYVATRVAERVDVGEVLDDAVVGLAAATREDEGDRDAADAGLLLEVDEAGVGVAAGAPGPVGEVGGELDVGGARSR